MKKSKLFLGMLVMVLVFGMTFISCGDDNDGNNPPPATTGSITIQNQVGNYFQWAGVFDTNWMMLTMTNQGQYIHAGQSFTFSGVTPGTYRVQVTDHTGQVWMRDLAVQVTAGQTTTVQVPSGFAGWRWVTQ